MYRILLDSSNRELAVGLAYQNRLLDTIEYEAWQRQSETMIPEINRLMVRNNVQNEDIEAIVVSIGPGSYTGVRIALTIAKVMALALSCPLYGVSSLQILRAQSRPSICLINARSNRSYIGVYRDEHAEIEDTIWPNEQVLDFIKNHPDYAVCGDVDYLNISCIDSNILDEMLQISLKIPPEKDILGVKPKYLKD